jgi:tetratricopeptide (TPR) repeat protein
MSKRMSTGSLVSTLAGEGLGDLIGKLCEAASKGDATAIAALLGSLAGAPLVAAGILIGGVAVQMHGQKVRDRKMTTLIEELGRQWEASGCNQQRFIDRMTPFIERRDHFLARLPGYEKADLAGVVAKAVREELSPLLTDGAGGQIAGADRIDWDDVALFLNQNNKLLDALDDLIRAEHEKTRAHTTADGEKTREMLTTGRARLPTIPEGVVNNLADAGVRPNDDFVGRDDLIVRVHAALSAEGSAVLTHALSAEGGVGKTEIAVAYVFDAEYAETWEGIWWLDASAFGIEQALINALGLMGFADADGLDKEARRAEFVRRLGSGHHLVVLDNLDDRATLAGLTVPTTSRVLVTTRLSREKLPPALANTIDVEVFAPEDSARLLVKHRPDLKDEATGLPLAEHAGTIATIAAELGQHALAVALTAAALRVDAGVTPVALLERLRAVEIGEADHPFLEMDAGDTGRNYGRKVAASLLLHLDDLEREYPLAGPVLLAASLCHPEAVPFSLLAGCAAAPRVGVEGEEQDIRKAVCALADRSIVRFDGGKGVDKRGLLDVHRLTQSALRHRAGDKAVDAMADAVVGALNGMLDDCEVPERWPKQSEALPHARAVLAVRPKDSAERSRLLNQSAGLHETLGRAGEAEPVYVEALEMCRSLFKGDHPDIADSLNNLALCRKTLGRAAEAEPMHEEALAMRRRLFTGDHSDIAESLNNLALCQDILGRAAEAEPMHEEALEMFMRLYPDGHPSVATSLGNLAGVRQALGRAAEAEPVYVEALEMRRRLFEGDHRDVAESLNNLAFVRDALGRAGEAEPLYVEALEMRRCLFEGDHPDVATSLSNLALCWQTLGRATDVEPMHEQALAMYKRLYEGDHPDIALSLNNLASVRNALGRAAEAEPVFVEALEMLKRLYPGDHPAAATSLSNLAYVRNALGRAAEAEPMHIEALEMRRRLFEGDHPDVATSLNNLAGVWETLGRAGEAEPVYVEALEMFKGLYEGDHPAVATSLDSLAGVRNALGRAGEAEPVYVEALEMRRRLFEGDHPAVAGSLNNLAYVRGMLGRWAEALGPSEDAVVMAERCLPEGHPLRVSWEQNLAFIRAKLGGG